MFASTQLIVTMIQYGFREYESETEGDERVKQKSETEGDERMKQKSETDGDERMKQK